MQGGEDGPHNEGQREDQKVNHDPSRGIWLAWLIVSHDRLPSPALRYRSVFGACRAGAGHLVQDRGSVVRSEEWLSPTARRVEALAVIGPVGLGQFDSLRRWALSRSSAGARLVLSRAHGRSRRRRGLLVLLLRRLPRPAVSHGADRVSSADRCPQPASWVLGPCWYETVRKFIPRLNPSGHDEPPPTA